MSTEPWTRAQWLVAAEQVAAAPLASRAKLDKLLSTDAWRTIDRTAFAPNSDVLQFFPAFKKLTLALSADHGRRIEMPISLSRIRCRNVGPNLKRIGKPSPSVFASCDAKRGFTQVALARQLGLSQNRLSEIEGGDGSFSAEQFLRILRLFNVGASEFASSGSDRGLEVQNALARLGAAQLHDLNLTASQTAYVKGGKGSRAPLRFTKSGDAALERVYARHFVWPGKGPLHPPRPRVDHDG